MRLLRGWGRSPLEAESFLPFVCGVEQRNWLRCLCFGILQLCSMKVLRERLWERCNSSVTAGATHVYGNAVPTQKYSRKRPSYAFPLHYTPACKLQRPQTLLCTSWIPHCSRLFWHIGFANPLFAPNPGDATVHHSQSYISLRSSKWKCAGIFGPPCIVYFAVKCCRQYSIYTHRPIELFKTYVKQELKAN